MDRKGLSYLLGVLQGDGSLYHYEVNDRGRRRVRHALALEAKDIEMMKKSKSIFEDTFERKVTLQITSRGLYRCTFHVKTLMGKFRYLNLDFSDPPTPPKWIRDDVRFFGPYLAGLIDADGSICIKRKLYPQCKVEISSGSRPDELIESIKGLLNCGVSSEMRLRFNRVWGIRNEYCSTVFLVSSKNSALIKNHVLPNIVIPRKRKRLEDYFGLRHWNDTNT